MTLLELAKLKGMTMLAIREEIWKRFGVDIPCSQNHIISDGIAKKICFPIFNRQGKSEEGIEYIKRKTERRYDKEWAQKEFDDLEIFYYCEDETITFVKQLKEDCVVLDFDTGGTLTLSRSRFEKYKLINVGDVVGLDFTDSNNDATDEHFSVRYVLPKKQWQKTKIEQAHRHKRVIAGKILYPCKDIGYFVNIYGIRAIMYNKHIDQDEELANGDTVYVAVLSVEINDQICKVSVTQKYAETLSKQINFEKIYKDAIEDCIIDRIERNKIIVKLKGCPCIIYKSDLFWCNVKDLNKHLEVGNPIRAKVVSKEEINGKFKVRLSHKEFAFNPWIEENNPYFHEGDMVSGPITGFYDNFFIIKIAEGVEGILHANNMSCIEFKALNEWKPGMDDINVQIKSIDAYKKRIELCIPASEEVNDVWNNIDYQYREDNIYKGVVVSNEEDTIWVQLQEGIEASINKKEKGWPKCITKQSDDLPNGKVINILITKIDNVKRKIYASYKRLIPNPWETAKVSLRTGDICSVVVIDRKEKKLVIETQDSFHLIGIINRSELSWFPLKQDEEPQIGDRIDAKVMIFQPERFNLQLSVRQLQEDPWNDLYLGAEVKGVIQTQTDPAFINVQLENKLPAKTRELEFIKYIGETLSFKIVSCNRATQELIVSHNILLHDLQNEEIVKRFFNVQ